MHTIFVNGVQIGNYEDETSFGKALGCLMLSMLGTYDMTIDRVPGTLATTVKFYHMDVKDDYDPNWREQWRSGK